MRTRRGKTNTYTVVRAAPQALRVSTCFFSFFFFVFQGTKARVDILKIKEAKESCSMLLLYYWASLSMAAHASSVVIKILTHPELSELSF